MGIEAIDGYGGTINSSNALEIYKDREFYNNLRPSQQKYVQKFLTQEQMDQVDYDMQSVDTKNKGKDKINTEGTEGGAGVGSAAAMVGTGAALGATIAAMCKDMTKLTKTAKTNGFTSLASAIPAVVGAAMALVFSFPNMFDAGYNDRKARSDESGDTNEIIQSHSDALNESMNMMDESLENYQSQVEDYTDVTNGNNSRAAELEIEIADAEAMGDMDKAKALREELAALSEFDYSGMEENMDATREELDEYSMMAEESQGVAEAGSSVADFLKVGKTLSIVAYVNGALLAATTLILGIAAVVGGIPKAPFFLDKPAAIASTVLWMVSALTLGIATTKMFSNAKDEAEFGGNGDTMAGYVDTLNKTIEDHIGYTEVTTEEFDATDEDSEESIEENNEKANEAKEQADKTRKPAQEDESEEKPNSVIS